MMGSVRAAALLALGDEAQRLGFCDGAHLDAVRTPLRGEWTDSFQTVYEQSGTTITWECSNSQGVKP